ncbi:Uncharacterised protein [Bordetella pertussis]|nr:Uncharacterised protein [Bordetella pertussis]CFO06895.1 Uncharacterised protein [Bordetella pertussis]CFP13415.1 Uncharacterised protein [Bordetella pertussis]CPI54477.1 Uncharacterised protein [Bordetella pertussis]CPK03338.1 Uncharacterised protein [Bordetella pertussis]
MWLCRSSVWARCRSPTVSGSSRSPHTQRSTSRTSGESRGARSDSTSVGTTAARPAAMLDPSQARMEKNTISDQIATTPHQK